MIAKKLGVLKNNQEYKEVSKLIHAKGQNKVLLHEKMCGRRYK